MLAHSLSHSQLMRESTERVQRALHGGNPDEQGLVQSILEQDSPLVQSALADVMLKLQEKRAVKSFKKLLKQKDLNGMVKTKIEQTISRLT